MQQTFSWRGLRALHTDVPKRVASENVRPRHRPWAQTEEDGSRVLIKGMQRTRFALMVYPHETQKKACELVIRDIMTNPRLKYDMRRAGYVPGKRGFTAEQMALLLAHYALNITAKNND